MNSEILARIAAEREAIIANNLPRGHKNFVTDYWFCCDIDTPKEKRREMAMGDIYENACICGKCGDYIRSKNRRDMRYCMCKSIAVDGGSWYARRIGDFNLMIECITPFRDALCEIMEENQ